jgi:hypothetical protein
MEKPITADFTYWIGCVQRFGPHIGGGECLVDLLLTTIILLTSVRDRIADRDVISLTLFPPYQR